MYHKDVVVVVNRHDDCRVPPGVPEMYVDMEISSRAEGTRASRKGPLDGARDPPSFSVGVVDPMHSSRDMPVNLSTTDKETNFICNLGQNLPVLPDSPECAVMRANMKGDRLTSRF